jgi:hypothetical protein
VRYLFRGLIRETAGPVEGHVEAANEDAAFMALSDNGVVTESLTPDPAPLNLNEELPQSPEFADALSSAFDSSSSQIEFDRLAERYHGKKVWVIDRDKIRRRVAQVVDAALALGAHHGEGAGKIRERVANALQGVFSDNQNLATERNAESVAGMRFNPADSVTGFRLNNDSVAGVRFNGAPMPSFSGESAVGIPVGGHPALDVQIGKLANLIRQAETTLIAIGAAARRGGGDGPRRRSFSPAHRGEEQNTVLLEIFKSNLDLVRSATDRATAQLDLPHSAASFATAGEPITAAPADEPPADAFVPQSSSNHGEEPAEHAEPV